MHESIANLPQRGQVFVWSNYWPGYKLRMVAMTHHIRQLQVNPDWKLV